MIIIMNHIKVNDKEFCVLKNNYFLPPHKSGKKLYEWGNYMNTYSNVFLPAVMTMKSFRTSPVADGIVCMKN